MAYRQLCAVSFAVLGLALAGCGGNTSSADGNVSDASQPPASSDQPPGNGDQPPESSDRPPSNPDKPPGSADAPAGTGGGRTSTLCRQFCDTVETLVDRCTMGMEKLEMTELCSGELNCQLPATPCDNQLADLFDCFIDNISGLCVAPGNGNGEQQTPNAEGLCQGAFDAVAACTGDNSGNGNGNGNGNGDGDNVTDCTSAGGCNCATACAECLCEAEGDLDDSQACSLDECRAP